MQKITETYKDQILLYESFRDKIEVLVKELLGQGKINFHKIESRIKDPISLDKKIIKKNDKYSELIDITDLLGIRIITYFEDEVEKVAQIIQSEFKLDKDNSIDKRQLESDRFGYKSLHYVVSLKTDREILTEYKRFKDIKFEIQIRSILQHAWAEIEHDIGYKGEHAVPDLLKRNFYRVAALLETADVEFVNIKNALKKYEAEIPLIIKSHPEEVEINSASLYSFIDTDELVKLVDQRIAMVTHHEVMKEPHNVNSLVEKLLFNGIKTIKQLKTLLIEKQQIIVPFAELWLRRERVTIMSLMKGICLSYLGHVLTAEKQDVEVAEEYVKLFGGPKRENLPLAKKMIEVYKAVNK